MAKILYIENNKLVAAQVKSCLKQEGHLVEIAENGEDGLQLCRNFEYDIILIDCGSTVSAAALCADYRRSGGSAWVIILSQLPSVESVERGLDAGADDFMLKRMDLRELAARVRRSLRRAGTEIRTELRIGNVVLNPEKRLLFVQDQSVSLTPKEAALLEYLMRHPNKFVSTNKLLAAVWPSGCNASSGTVRTFMRNLRQKLISAGEADLIKTVLGSGYTIEQNAAAAGCGSAA